MKFCVMADLSPGGGGSVDARAVRRDTWRWAGLGLLAVVLVGTLVYLLVLDSGHSELVDVALAPGSAPSTHQPRLWLVLALVVGAVSLTAWAWTERERAALARTADALEAAQGRHERQDRDAEAEREALERKLALEQDRRRQEAVRSERTLRAWRAERDFTREMRGQIARLQRASGALGRHDDVRELVLKLTMELVEAEKGILLGSAKASPGELEVVAFAGFENDPSDSALARRFAGEVIARDATIREDAPPRADRRTAADTEVANLLAIPIYLTDEFSGVVVCANREGGFADFDEEVLVAVGDHAGAVLANSRLHADLRSAYLSTIAVLADAIELKDRDLRGHSDAVSHYVLAVADRLDFEPDRREALIFASLLHDVGKLGISERILLKPGRLTPEERTVIELHPRLGYDLVRQVPALAEIAPAILHHHERFDGDGYPARLKGEAIPLEARIIAIADTFSAITSDRPYDRPRSTEEACAELERCAGGQFDPEVVRLFNEEVRRRPPELLELLGPAAGVGPELDAHLTSGEFKLGGRSFALTDSLTLLYSLRHFHETVRAEAQVAGLQGRPFAVVVVTLLDLGELNRTVGFSAGDEALRIAAKPVQQLAAELGGLAFRASGRRLALVVPDADLISAADVAAALQSRLLAAAADVSRVGVGTALWSAGDDGEAVIDRACLAADQSEPVS